MAHLLNIQSSPRGLKSASIGIADAFLHAYLELHPETTVDTLNVWEEHLPEYDAQGIGAKYKGTMGEPMVGVEAATWDAIQSLAARFRRADRIVIGVPMWNFAYPYKLKQLIDLASQRNLMFSFDGKSYGPLLTTPKALVIYTRGGDYQEGSSMPASRFDHQSPYIEFWLKFVGVQQVVSLVVPDTWTDHTAQALAAGRLQAERLARDF